MPPWLGLIFIALGAGAIFGAGSYLINHMNQPMHPGDRAIGVFLTVFFLILGFFGIYYGWRIQHL